MCAAQRFPVNGKIPPLPEDQIALAGKDTPRAKGLKSVMTNCRTAFFIVHPAQVLQLAAVQIFLQDQLGVMEWMMFSQWTKGKTL